MSHQCHRDGRYFSDDHIDPAPTDDHRRARCVLVGTRLLSDSDDSSDAPVAAVVDEGWEGSESWGLLGVVEVTDDPNVQGGEIGIINTVADKSVDEVVAKLQETEGITFSEPEPSSLAGLDGVVLTADAPAEEVSYGWLYEDMYGNWYSPRGVAARGSCARAPIWHRDDLVGCAHRNLGRVSRPCAADPRLHRLGGMSRRRRRPHQRNGPSQSCHSVRYIRAMAIRLLPALSISLLSISLLSACSSSGSEPDAVAPVTEPTASTQPESAASTEPASASSSVTPTTEPVADGTAQPLPYGELAAGTYVANKFAVPVTFVVDDGWEAYESATTLGLVEIRPDGAASNQAGEFTFLTLASEMSVDEVVAALATTEGVTYSEPLASTVGGLDGVVVTSDGSAGYVSYPWAFDTHAGGPWFTAAGMQQEVHVVAHDTGTVLIWLDAPAAEWEMFQAQAQPVLDSIAWEG